MNQSRRWTISLAASLGFHAVALAGLGSLVLLPPSQPPRVILPRGETSLLQVFLVSAPAPQDESISDPAPADDVPAKPIDPWDAAVDDAEPSTLADVDSSATVISSSIAPGPPLEWLHAEWTKFTSATQAAASHLADELESAVASTAHAVRLAGSMHQASSLKPQDSSLPSQLIDPTPSLASAHNTTPPGIAHAPSPLASNRPPVYPEESRRRRESGTVLIHIKVDTRGAVTTAEVIRSSGHDRLDQSALAAVRDWRFVPATDAGSAISCEANLPVEFFLR